MVYKTDIKAYPYNQTETVYTLVCISKLLAAINSLTASSLLTGIQYSLTFRFNYVCAVSNPLIKSHEWDYWGIYIPNKISKKN